MTETNEQSANFNTSPTTESDDALASLQDEVESIKNDRNEERFLLVLVILMLFDVLIFSQIQNWAGVLVIGILQIFGVAVLARKWQIEEVPQMLSKLLDRTSDQLK